MNDTNASSATSSEETATRQLLAVLLASALAAGALVALALLGASLWRSWQAGVALHFGIVGALALAATQLAILLGALMQEWMISTYPGEDGALSGIVLLAAAFSYGIAFFEFGFTTAMLFNGAIGPVATLWFGIGGMTIQWFWKGVKK